ncbi:MAG: IS1 family transposase [Lacipirellulaceae bacterium]
MILSALVEGNSINATARMVGCSKVTILRLLADAGTFCAQWHNIAVRELQSKRVQLDEIWCFCGCKDKAKENGAQGFGSVWTWTAIDADSKLCISYLVGLRDSEHAGQFCNDVAKRLAGRAQVTSDGLHLYTDAIEGAFAGSVDYAKLVKIYGEDAEGHKRYSPGVCIGCKKNVEAGSPDPDHISTSYVERQNLTMRMSMRRYTRLTNGFSKKIENHEHAVALHYFYYNFIRKHQTLKTTPAVASGIANKALTVRDLVDMIEAEEKKLGERLSDYLPSPSR